MPEFKIPVTQDEYEKSGSKFIIFSSDDPPGKLYHKPVELDMPDWDTPGQSIKFPVRIASTDSDGGKEDKLSCGVAQNAVWKLKETLFNLGVDVTFKDDAPHFNSEEVAGKKAVGEWEIQMGSKGGDPAQGQTKYPKLVALLPAGFKPSTGSLV